MGGVPGVGSTPVQGRPTTFNMSSVSNRSRFSVKSQQVMAEQDGVIAEQASRIRDMVRKMAEMKRMLVEAGLAPAVTAISTASATVTDLVCGIEVDFQVRVQYARMSKVKP